MVSAVGHETDFTIADFVADLRAPTPSAAAELITAAQHGIAERVGETQHRLQRAAQYQLLQARQRLGRVSTDRAVSRMTTVLHRLEQRLDDASERASSAMQERVRGDQRHVAELHATVLHHDPRRRLAHAAQHVAAAGVRLEHSVLRALHDGAARLHALQAQLTSLSPLAVLDRGYALVLDEHGELVRSIVQIAAGERVVTRLTDGAFTSRVEETELKKQKELEQ